MAFQCSKATTIIVLLNIIFFTYVSSHDVPIFPNSVHSIPYIPKTKAKPQAKAKCPNNTLKFGVCGSWLGLVTEVIGSKPSKECCTLLSGLADLEAALCLCTALKANVLGVVQIDVPVALTLLVNGCGKKIPNGFVCG